MAKTILLRSFFMAKNILRIFFAAAVMSCSTSLYAANSIMTAGGIEIRMAEHIADNHEIVEWIRILDRQLMRSFRSYRSVSAPVISIMLTGGETTICEVEELSGEVLITLGGPFEQWRYDPQVISSLAAFLQLPRLGLSPIRHREAFPQWICDGMVFFQRTRQERRSLLNIREFTGLRALLAEDLEIDFAAAPRNATAAGAIGGAFYELHQECCAFLMDTFYDLGGKNDNLLTDYVIYLSEGNSLETAWDMTLGRVILERHALIQPYSVLEANLSDNEKTKAFLMRQANAKIFTSYTPLPAATLRRRIEEAAKVEYSPDQSAETVTAELAALPQLYDQFENCRALPSAKAMEFREIAISANADVQLSLFQLINAISSINQAPAVAVEREITRTLEKIYQQIDQYQKMEDFLAEVEAATLPAGLLFEREYMEVKRERPAMSRSLEQYLNQVESAYLEK